MRLLAFRSRSLFAWTATAPRAQRRELRLQSPMRYRKSRRHSSGSGSLFAGHFHYVARSPHVSGSPIIRLSISMGRGAGQPTLKWMASSLPRPESSGFTSRLPKNQQTGTWPDYLITFTLKRPLKCDWLAETPRRNRSRTEPSRVYQGT